MAQKAKSLPTEEAAQLLAVLEKRFGENPARHGDVSWQEVAQKLEERPEKLWSLQEMERTGGEPDVIGRGKEAGTYVFCDCAAESPTGRRSLCYDQAALDARKENKPQGSAQGLAAAMGIRLLNEEEYRQLQSLGAFDCKTSSWIDTPEPVRKLGGGFFCDRRYDHVFLYHNGVESYYAARGFRGLLLV